MPGLEIQAFSDGHIDAAAALLRNRHRRHCAQEQLLTAEHDFRAEVAALAGAEGASGAVATRGRRVAGYLLGIRKSDETWGANVWVEPAGHAVDDAEDVRDLYAAAATRWVDEGRTRHYAVAPAADGDLLHAWNRLGFGRQQAYAVRDVPEATWPAGTRSAAGSDVDALVELGPLLDEHQRHAPVFSTIPSDAPDEIRNEILDDLANPEAATLVAERDGRIVGTFFLVPATMSPSHNGVVRIDGSLLLAWAVTKPDIRGSGVGVALTDASFAWAHERGYRTMVTDWRETNLLSSRFWPARGFRPTFLRLYRSIP